MPSQGNLSIFAQLTGANGNAARERRPQRRQRAKAVVADGPFLAAIAATFFRPMIPLLPETRDPSLRPDSAPPPV